MNRIIELLQHRLWLGPLLALIVGLAVGLPVGWFTVDWTPGADEVAATADSYSVNNDLALARGRLRGLSRTDLTRVLTNLIRDSNARNQLREADRLTQLAQAMGINISPVAVAPTSPTSTAPRSATPAPSSPFGFFSGIIPLLVVFLLAGLVAAAGLVFVLRVLPTLKTSQPSQGVRRTGVPPAVKSVTPLPAKGIKASSPAPASSSAPAAASAAAAKTAGMGKHLATFTLGNDNYDTSFSLESPQKDFMGECGMGISETIGEGKPDKVTAFDLWLFDKGDVRTVTQILMSEYAYNDQAMRAKLAAKGAAVLAEKGKTISLDTASLRLNAKILEIAYANTPGTPANSHFQKLSVEIVPSLKESVAA